MEIKCVQREKNEYPKINEISNIKIKQDIPNKWKKLGITSFIFGVLTKQRVLAVTPSDIPSDTVIAGGMSYYNPIHDYVKCGCNIVSLISTLTFVISVIMVLYKNLKKQEPKIKVSSKIKIVFILSIILLVLSRIGILIVNHLKY